jgi:hypothetical protein
MGQQLSASVINTSGRVASDLHLIFSGTGGNISVDPLSLAVVPGGAPVPKIASNPPAISNEVDIEWDNPAVPPDATVNFVVATRAGPLKFISGYWTGMEPERGRVILGPVVEGDIILKMLSDEFVPPVKVLNSSGHSTPFVAARIVGTSILSGLTPVVAIDRAKLIDNAIEAAGLDTVTTDGIRRALDEIGGSLQPPSLGRIGGFLGSDPARKEFVAPAVEPIVEDPIDNPVERAGMTIVQSLGNLETLSEQDTPGIPSPLAELLTNAAKSMHSAAPAFAGVIDLSGAFWHLTREMQDGIRAANDPEQYIAWQPQLIKSAEQFVRVLDGYPSLALARSPITALQAALANLEISSSPEQRANFLWQIPIINALASTSRHLDISLPQTAEFVRYMLGLRHDCPPCHADCKFGSSTLYMSGKLTNPHDCKTVDHRIMKLPLMHVWVRTCKWDAEVHYKRIYLCRKKWFDPVRNSMCCWSIFEWSRKETWTYSQQKVNFSSTVPTDWASEITDIRFGDRKLSPPPDARQTY